VSRSFLRLPILPPNLNIRKYFRAYCPQLVRLTLTPKSESNTECRLPRWNANIQGLCSFRALSRSLIRRLRIFPYAAVKFIVCAHAFRFLRFLTLTRVQETTRNYLLRTQAFYTIDSSASGKPGRPSCLHTACLIHTEGSPHCHYHPHRHLHQQHLCLATSSIPFRSSGSIVASQSAWRASYLTQAPRSSRGDTCTPP
jgi:hypothetical protein